MIYLFVHQYHVGRKVCQGGTVRLFTLLDIIVDIKYIVYDAFVSREAGRFEGSLKGLKLSTCGR
jgi:hypothetical protein